MSVIKIDFRERIALLIKQKRYLEAFLLQSTYIESVIKRLFRYSLSLSAPNNVANAVSRERRNVSPLLSICKNAGWIEKAEYDKACSYFKERNDIVHDLVGSELDNDRIRHLLKKGEEILQDHGEIEKFINLIQTEHGRGDSVVMQQSIELTEREKLIFKERIEGKTLEAIGGKYHVTRERIRQIVKEALRKMEGLVSESTVKARRLAQDIQRKSADADIFIQQVCSKENISVQTIKGTSRKAEVVLVRHFIAYALREKFELSYPIIGQKLGGRDHTTIMHAHRRIINILKQQKQSQQL